MKTGSNKKKYEKAGAEENNQYNFNPKSPLKQNNRKVRDIDLFMDNVPVGLLLIDKNLTVSLINRQAEQLFCLRRNLIIGKSVEQLFSASEDPQKYISPDDQSVFEKVITDGSPVFDVPQEIKLSDGQKKVLSINAYPIKNDSGDILEIVATVVDITERYAREDKLRQSEERFRIAFKTSPDAININRLEDGLYIDINEGFTQLTGFTREDVINKTSLEINIWANPKDREKLVDGLLKDGYVNNLEARFRLKNGNMRTGLMSARIINLNGEKHILSITRDIHDQRKLQDSIKKISEQYQATINAIDDIVFVIDRKLRIIIYNDACRIKALQWGIKNAEKENGFGETFLHLTKNIEEDYSKVFRSGKTIVREDKIIINEREIWIESRLNPIYDKKKKENGVVVNIREITERRITQNKLSDTLALFHAAIEQSPAGIIIGDAPDVKIHVANSAALGIRGQSSEPLTNIPVKMHPKHWQTFYPDGTPYKAEDLPLSKAILEGKTSSNVEVIIRRQSGEDRWVSATAAPVRNAKGEIIAGVVIFPDITDSKKAEETLKESEEKYRLLVTNASEAIFVSQGGKLKFYNPKTLDVFNCTKKEIQSKAFTSFIHPEDYPKIKKLRKGLLKGKQLSLSQILRISDKNGGIRWVEVNSVRIKWDKNPAVLHFINDITEKKMAEEEKQHIRAQLYQAQKMEAIGTLAGGIAHDFNNLLTTIQGYTDLAMLELAENSPSYNNLKQVNRAATRAADLTRQLLLFSRKQKMELSTLNLNLTIENMQKMLDRLIGEDIKIHTQLSRNLRKVWADAGNIEQVIMNFVVNARDAMPDGGVITLKTQNVSIRKDQIKDDPEARTGTFVCLSISDTGIGIDEENLQHIFEPFFTTKEIGRGTGLGLAVVYGIIKQHKGWIKVRSQVDLGSTFDIYLPVSAKKVLADKKDISPLKRFRGNGERILYIEDEQGMQDFVVEVLQEYGYKVSAAFNAKEAMKIFKMKQRDFHLVFSDVVLPDRDGIQLVDQLLEERPDLRVLLYSGYADKKSQINVIKKRGFKFLRKPFALAQLLKAVKEVLA